MLDQVKELAEEFRFSQHLGVELVEAETDQVVLRLPYAEHLGIDRVGGGAISALVDVAASCAFWSNDAVGVDSRGATIGFTINFLRLVKTEDLHASATVRRRGGSVCVADVTVTNTVGEEVAIAIVTYKLNP
jgi:uncharacterized protein (TIGR00369 family)